MICRNVTIDESDHDEIRRWADDWQEPQWYIVHRLVELGKREEALRRKRKQYTKLLAEIQAEQ